jgi:RNA ligase partner protein
MQGFIIDTNIFFNMEAGLGLGQTTKEIASKLNKIVKNLASEDISIITTPTVVEEIKSFFETEQDEVLLQILSCIKIKSPSTQEMKISALLFDSLISEYRERSYRGMKVAEEELIETGKLFMGKEVLLQKEFQQAIGKKIATLRDRFRNATRKGTIDSQADLDIILLAKELNLPLVTTDEGVVRWARMVGVSEISPSVFGKKMQEYF